MKRLLTLIAGATLCCCTNAHSNNTPAQPAETKADAPAEAVVTELSTEAFVSKIFDYKKTPVTFLGKKPAVIDRYATWCGPCKAMAPIMEELAKEYAGKVDFYKMDVDKTREIANYFEVKSIPYFVLIGADGKISQTIGSREKAEFKQVIEDTFFAK